MRDDEEVDDWVCVISQFVRRSGMGRGQAFGESNERAIMSRLSY